MSIQFVCPQCKERIAAVEMRREDVDYLICACGDCNTAFRIAVSELSATLDKVAHARAN